MPKYWVKKLFRTWEFPRSGSKARDGEKRKERKKVGDNNGQATHGARKPPGPIYLLRDPRHLVKQIGSGF